MPKQCNRWQDQLLLPNNFRERKQLKTKNLLMLCASRDDIVPPEAAKVLWEATGKQKIVWYDATHVSTAVFIMPLLREMTEHIRGVPQK